MSSTSLLKVALLAVIASLASCSRDPGFVVSLRNTSNEMITDTTVQWDRGIIRVGAASPGVEKLFYDNPTPIPESMTISWLDGKQQRHESTMELRPQGQGAHRVFIYFVISSSPEVSVHTSHE